MYTKIICENGKIFLCNDINEKIQTVNNINLIEIAEIDNKIELLNDEIGETHRKIKKEKSRINVLVLDNIFLFFQCLAFTTIPILKTMFDLLINLIPIFIVVKIALYTYFPFLIIYRFLKVIPKGRKKEVIM